MTDMKDVEGGDGLRADPDIRRYYEALGQGVRAARAAARVTQEELGGALGLSRTSIANLEAGRQRVPVHLLAQAARRLGVDLTALVPPVDDQQDAGVLPGLKGAPEEHVRMVRRLLSAVPEEARSRA